MRTLQFLGITYSKPEGPQRDLTDRSDLPPPKRAIEWIRANECPRGGIYTYPGYADAFPEITGYLIPTLLSYEENALAIRLVDWLLRIQGRDGSYPGPTGAAHVFDTGQVLRGLLAATNHVQGTLEASMRTASYLYASMKNDGKEGFAIDSVWIKQYGKVIPESSHLYVLPVLRQAAEQLHQPKYSTAVDNCLEYYLRDKRALQMSTLTHFLAYELEALIDLGRNEVALPILKALRNVQDDDGSVRGMDGVSWVCTPGLAQLAICWYKLGEREPADRAMNWLDSHQTPSGGFLGSYGETTSWYFPNAELPWAAKFYLDANLLRCAAVS